MFIVWGTKRTERKQGMVADFCPICREARAFQLIRVGLASHIYYLSFGEGKLAGYIIRCSECGVGLGTQATRYANVEKDPRVSLEVLIRDTFPKLREVYAERLELEGRIRRTRSALSGDDYRRFLMEPFGLLNPLVEQRFANSTQIDRPAGIGCLGTLLIGAAIFFGSMKFSGPTQDKMLLAALIAVVMGCIYTLIQMHLGTGRFYRAKILPPLVKALKPLEPTKDDLADCIGRCQSMGLRIGKVAKTEEIWLGLERSLAGFDR